MLLNLKVLLPGRLVLLWVWLRRRVGHLMREWLRQCVRVTMPSAWSSQHTFCTSSGGV
jgi:hypothetical protein